MEFPVWELACPAKYIPAYQQLLPASHSRQTHKLACSPNTELLTVNHCSWPGGGGRTLYALITHMIRQQGPLLGPRLPSYGSKLNSLSLAMVVIIKHSLAMGIICLLS